MSSAALSHKQNRWSTPDTIKAPPAALPPEKRSPAIKLPTVAAPSNRPKRGRPRVYKTERVNTSVHVHANMMEAVYGFLEPHRVSFSRYVESLIEADMNARGLWPVEGK